MYPGVSKKRVGSGGAEEQRSGGRREN